MNRKLNRLRLTKPWNRISWTYDNEYIFVEPTGAIDAIYFLDHRNEIIVLTESCESNNENLFIYGFDGQLRLRPKMPALSKPVNGVYDIWFKPNSNSLTVMLLTEHFRPYDTRCKFNVETGEFSEFESTK